MKTENNELMTENQMCLWRDVVAEVESHISVGDYLVCGEQRQRITDIYYLSTHCCVTIVLADGGKLGWGRLKKMVLEAGKGKIVKCSQKNVHSCEECSLTNYGRDCNNNKIY